MLRLTDHLKFSQYIIFAMNYISCFICEIDNGIIILMIKKSSANNIADKKIYLEIIMWVFFRQYNLFLRKIIIFQKF